MFSKRHKQTPSLKDQLASFAEEVRRKADRLPPGRDREELLQKASRADHASHLNDLFYSSGLQPPT